VSNQLTLLAHLQEREVRPRHIAGTMKTYDGYILMSHEYFSLIYVNKWYFDENIFNKMVYGCGLSVLFIVSCINDSFSDLLNDLMAYSRLQASERDVDIS